MSNTQQGSSFRPEIQGIRTIGALLVACFHIWGGRVSGGVDVFFVISGFLITGSLYREVQRTQVIDILAFWGRIAKRVAPMAYLVLGLTLAAAVLWMPASRQDGFLAEVFFSAFHLENIKLMMNSVDYLARDEAPSPVQQFWALSVQVQFYAVWPFLLLGAALAARRLRAGAWACLAALGAVFLASLAYSVLQTRLDPSPTYFDPFARVWEFALGGLLAVGLPLVRIPAAARLVAGWVGLAAVVSCGFVFGPSVHFPGIVALWPTLGAALVLLSGGAGLRFGVDRLLGARPLAGLGDISFAFYLWHWPVLIFALMITGRTQLGWQAGLQVIGIALCGAYLSTRFLERPIQQSSIGARRAWHAHAMAAAFAVPVLLAASLWTASIGSDDRAEEMSVAQYPGGTIPAALETAATPGVPLRPSVATAKRDISRVYRDKCHQNERSADILECAYGTVTGATKTIALVGGSHSAHWLAALESLAQENGWRILNITKSACPLEISARYKPSCIAWNERIIDHLARARPDAIITTSTRRRPVGPDHDPAKGGREYVPEGYLAQWARLAEKGLSVIAIRDNPWMRGKVPQCLEAANADFKRCMIERRLTIDDVDPAVRLEPKPANVAFIDMTDRFCDRVYCYPVSGNVVMYSDSHHITATFARTLAGTLGERIRQVRPDLFPSTLKTSRSAGAGQ